MNLRPAGVARHAVVLAVMAGAFVLIARSTGSGWLVVLLCGALGTLVVAAVWPALALPAVRLEVRAPADATAGQPVAVDLAVTGGRGLMRIRCMDPPSEAVRAEPPCHGPIVVVPARRGVIDTVTVDVRSAAPLGLFSWRRRLAVRLPRPIEVGPTPFTVSLAQVIQAGESGSDAIPRGRVGHESVRGVREYVPGDPIRLVHWPSTAHRGDLVVKEMENPDAPLLILVVDLRGGGDAAEQAASRAAGIARAALRTGLPVRMLTAERAGPVDALVGSAVEAGRRLARAVATAPGEVGHLPAGANVVRVTAR